MTKTNLTTIAAILVLFATPAFASTATTAETAAPAKPAAVSGITAQSMFVGGEETKQVCIASEPGSWTGYDIWNAVTCAEVPVNGPRG